MKGVLIKNSKLQIIPIRICIRVATVDKKKPVINQLAQKLLDFNPITLNPYELVSTCTCLRRFSFSPII